MTLTPSPKPGLPSKLTLYHAFDGVPLLTERFNNLPKV